MARTRIILLGFEIFYSLLRAYRVVWLRGRFGGGKTSLAVMLSAKLLADGYINCVVSNVPCTFSIELDKVKEDEGWAILLDESWLYLSEKSRIYDYAAYLRKLNHYLLLPSVWPLHYRLSFFSVMRVFNAYTIGLPVWVYRYDVSMRAFSEHGYFAVVRPDQIFNHFDTKFIPSDDGGVSERLRKYLTKRSARDDEVSESGVEEVEDAAAYIMEAAEDINGAIRVWRKRKR